MEPDHDLARQIDRALRELPFPRAPETLVPRVMSAIRARAERAWYRQPWLSWPLAWRIASGATAAIVIAVWLWSLSVAGTAAAGKLSAALAQLGAWGGERWADLAGRLEPLTGAASSADPRLVGIAVAIGIAFLWLEGVLTFGLGSLLGRMIRNELVVNDH
jgi:hypothetical protein